MPSAPFLEQMRDLCTAFSEAMRGAATLTKFKELKLKCKVAFEVVVMLLKEADFFFELIYSTFKQVKRRFETEFELQGQLSTIDALEQALAASLIYAELFKKHKNFFQENKIMRPCKLFPFSLVELTDLRQRTSCGPENVDEMLRAFRDELQHDQAKKLALAQAAAQHQDEGNKSEEEDKGDGFLFDLGEKGPAEGAKEDEEEELDAVGALLRDGAVAEQKQQQRVRGSMPAALAGYGEKENDFWGQIGKGEENAQNQEGWWVETGNEGRGSLMEKNTNSLQNDLFSF